MFPVRDHEPLALALGLGPVALSFLASDPGASMDDTRRHLESLIAAHGQDWAAVRLKECGLAEWAERLRAYRTTPGDSLQGDALDDRPLALPAVG